MLHWLHEGVDLGIILLVNIEASKGRRIYSRGPAARGNTYLGQGSSQNKANETYHNVDTGVKIIEMRRDVKFGVSGTQVPTRPGTRPGRALRGGSELY